MPFSRRQRVLILPAAAAALLGVGLAVAAVIGRLGTVPTPEGTVRDATFRFHPRQWAYEQGARGAALEAFADEELSVQVRSLAGREAQDLFEWSSAGRGAYRAHWRYPSVTIRTPTGTVVLRVHVSSMPDLVPPEAAGAAAPEPIRYLLDLGLDEPSPRLQSRTLDAHLRRAIETNAELSGRLRHASAWLDRDRTPGAVSDGPGPAGGSAKEGG